MSGGNRKQERVALVIGNSTYKHVPALPNTIKDADAVAQAFERLNFSKVLLRRDVNQSQFAQALADLGESATTAEIAVVYFAGHGIEIAGESYLLPVESELAHINRVKFETQPLRNVVSAVADAKTLGLVVVDACRDNSFGSRMRGIENTRSPASKGLAMIEPFGNTLVAYAAKHGTVARDGDKDGHSPFTRALLDYIERPNLELRLLFGKVRDSVLDMTGRQQEPHLYGSLGGKEIFLKPAVAPRVGTDVFVSYARKDKDQVALLARILQREGLDVFWDQDVIVGDDWRDVIKNRLGSARCVVAVWSENSISSDWVKWEAARGYDKGILIPLTIDGKSPARVFDEIQTEDLTNWDGSAHDPRIGKLLDGVRAIIEKTRPPTVEEKPVVDLAARQAPPPAPALDHGSKQGAGWGTRIGVLFVSIVAVLALAIASIALLETNKPSTSATAAPPQTASIAPPVVAAVVSEPAPPAPPATTRPAEVAIAPTTSEPAIAEEPASQGGKLDYKNCAIVLEAVKTCETLRDCSDSTLRENFTTGEQQHMASISGTAVFTTDNFYAHCKQVCKRKAYSLHPARDLLCGY